VGTTGRVHGRTRKARWYGQRRFPDDLTQRNLTSSEGDWTEKVKSVSACLSSRVIPLLEIRQLQKSAFVRRGVPVKGGR